MSPRPRILHPGLLSRREMLLRCANGFGAVAAMDLLAREGLAAEQALHHPARAQRVIFLYMDGAPSQVDTFDPKPRLDRENGQPIKMKVPPTQFDNVGGVLASPWKFKPYGECGLPVSDLFPHVGSCADLLCVVRSMVSKFPEHTGANYLMHTGHGQQGRPSMGAWVTYGLGSAAKDLPGFVVLDGGLIPPGGLDNFHNGFLPARYQGSIFRTGDEPVANARPYEPEPGRQERELDLVRALDRGYLERTDGSDEIESAIANQELAYRMQAAVPELMDLSGETKATRDLYGVDEEPTKTYGTLCLLARRLAERGVRFIELTCPNVGHDRWDQHANLRNGHRDNAAAVDKPIAGLLRDLESRDMLRDTLVIWGGEFGRTPMAQGTNGRDHNPHGFTMWLAGGGVRGGMVHGATDEYGYFAVENRVEVHDLHATMLYLLGFDHERLTFRYSGRDMRLTDVHGHVVHELLA